MSEELDVAIFKEQLSIKELENELAKMEQVETPVTHNFAEGVYVREMFIPKDTIIIGKRHRHETCNILLKGELSLYVGKGVPALRLKAPLIFNSKPWTKKIAYTHEDTIFLNVHPTNERDLEKIEDHFIIPEEEYEEQQKIGTNETLKLEEPEQKENR